MLPIVHVTSAFHLEWQIRRGVLVLEHGLKARIDAIALGALRLEGHPELKTLDVANMLAVGELLEAVTFFVVAKANEAPDDAHRLEAFHVSDHAHLDEMRRVHALLQHIVDAVLTQSLHRCLVLVDFFLDVRERVLVYIVCYLRVVMIHAAQDLESNFLDLG